MKNKTYNGNDIFGINCNLYGHEYIKASETLQDIRDEFELAFKTDLETTLEAIGLKYISLECYSPKYYNYVGDSIDLTIEVVDRAKYIKAVQASKDEINKRLASNKSYDGYIALTVNDISTEIERACHETDDDDFSPDTMCLGYLLQNAIDFKNGIDIYDYFVYDYDCSTDGCENQKESYEDEYCSECEAKQDDSDSYGVIE